MLNPCIPTCIGEPEAPAFTWKRQPLTAWASIMQSHAETIGNSGASSGPVSSCVRHSPSIQTQRCQRVMQSHAETNGNSGASLGPASSYVMDTLLAVNPSSIGMHCLSLSLTGIDSDAHKTSLWRGQSGSHRSMYIVFLSLGAPCWLCAWWQEAHQ